MAYNEDTDTLLIQSAADNSLSQGSTASADPDDLILVQRGDTLYQAKVSDLPSGPTAPPSNVAINLKQDAVNANRFTSNSFTTEVTGDDIEGVELKGEVTGALGLEAATLPITNNAYPGTSSTEVVLTLTDATNLDGETFAVGDVVKASGSHTPVSDEIVKVEAVSLWNKNNWSAVTQGNPNGTYVWPKTFNGNDTDPGANGVSNSVPYAVILPVPVSGTIRISTNVNSGNVPISYEPNPNVNNSAHWVTVSSNTDFVAAQPITAFGVYSTPQIRAIYVNGLMLVDSSVIGDGPPSSNINLTLSDKKDIELFQVGDVVQDGGTKRSLRQEWSDDIPMVVGIKTKNNGCLMAVQVPSGRAEAA